MKGLTEKELNRSANDWKMLARKNLLIGFLGGTIVTTGILLAVAVTML